MLIHDNLIEPLNHICVHHSLFKNKVQSCEFACNGSSALGPLCSNVGLKNATPFCKSHEYDIRLHKQYCFVLHFGLFETYMLSIEPYYDSIPVIKLQEYLSLLLHC